MFYDFAITIAADTAESDAVTQNLKLTKGVLHRFEVQFPAGCAGLAHIRFEQGAAHLFPTDPEGNFATDDFTIAFDDKVELVTAPFTIQAIAWNLDDTYPHTITVRIGILEGETAILLMRVIKGLVNFLKLVGVKV